MTAASVVVAARDAGATIGRAVRSALDQTLTDLEVILVDDASRDGTAEAARAAAAGDPRLRVVSLGRNLGPSGARNHGLAEARGRWIAILDGDDAFERDRLARLIGAAEASGADVACDDLLLVDEASGAEIGPMLGRGVLPGTIDLAAFATGDLPDRANPRRGFGYLKPVLRAGFLAARGLSYDEAMRFAEDYAFAVSCLCAGARWIGVDAPLYRYAVRSGSLTATHGAADLALLVAVDERALASEAARADPRAARALRRHRASVLKRERWALFVEEARARRWAALPGIAAHSPAILVHVARQLAAEAGRRARRRLPAPLLLGPGRASDAR